jgi:hypothetical protein
MQRHRAHVTHVDAVDQSPNALGHREGHGEFAAKTRLQQGVAETVERVVTHDSPEV